MFNAFCGTAWIGVARIVGDKHGVDVSKNAEVASRSAPSITRSNRRLKSLLTPQFRRYLFGR